MATREKPRILVAGAGIAGSLIVAGLAERDDVEVICVERDPAQGHLDAGTGLNIGPNAIKALTLFMPEQAERLVAQSLPWRAWTIELVDGTPLVAFDLLALADNPGIRIRWAELYALLRQPLGSRIRYDTELVTAGIEGGRPYAVVKSPRNTERIEGLDLLIAGDGRYSVIRQSLFATDPTNYFGVGLYRVLFPVDDDCPIGDYGQWFNGPNRLLAFRVPGNFVYCAGSFPIADDGVIPDGMKTGAALRQANTPASGVLSAKAAFLVEAVEANSDRIHWARLQDRTTRFAGPPGVLLAGDAAHPMVPTLGQGATQSVEDACVIVDEIRHALDGGRTLADVPARVAARREERVRFVVAFSSDATDTMMAGADPVGGSLKKGDPDFLARLERLYRDVGVPIS